MNFISYTNVTTERILKIRIRGHRFNMQRPGRRSGRINEHLRNRMMKRIVLNAEFLFNLSISQCIKNLPEGFTTLFRRCGRDIYRGSGSSFEETERKRKRGNEQRFSRFSRNENERLFESAFICSLLKKAQKRNNDKYLPLLQLQRFIL